METEMAIRIGAITIAVALLFSNVNFSKYWSAIKEWFKKRPKPVDLIDTEEEDGVAEKPFLEIVDLWYSLRDKCTEEGLDQAVEKLDEVFPLFNAENSDV